MQEILMKYSLKTLAVAAVVLSLGTAAWAKLPAPVLSEEASAKAAEAAAKTAWSGKIDAYRSCIAQDKVAAHYYKTAKAANKDVKPPQATPTCVEPGAFVYTPAEVAKPLEASGAHSPTPTATSPPSTKTPAAMIVPEKKS